MPRKVVREIHVPLSTRIDPTTGEELVPTNAIFKEWSPTLQTMWDRDPGARVAFVERMTDDTGRVHESCVHIPVLLAKERLEQGAPDLSAQAVAVAAMPADPGELLPQAKGKGK
jgi:hypothetical protein